jgi:hypothetical protein
MAGDRFPLAALAVVSYRLWKRWKRWRRRNDQPGKHERPE